MKMFVRKRTDQRYDTMLSLIDQSRTHFINIELYKKLFRRFWKSCEAYQNGQSYSDVLQLFFGSLCKEHVTSHRKITNTNIDIDNEDD
jgi:hypothetical protein